MDIVVLPLTSFDFASIPVPIGIDWIRALVENTEIGSVDISHDGMAIIHQMVLRCWSG